MKVSIKQLEFSSSIKDKILKLKDISKLHIDFIDGKYIHFENDRKIIFLKFLRTLINTGQNGYKIIFNFRLLSA